MFLIEYRAKIENSELRGQHPVTVGYEPYLQGFIRSETNQP